MAIRIIRPWIVLFLVLLAPSGSLAQRIAGAPVATGAAQTVLSTTTQSSDEIVSMARRVDTIGDLYLGAWLLRSPDVATLEGLQGASHERLPDNSSLGLSKWHEREDGWYRELLAMDPDRLVGRPQWATYHRVFETLDASIRSRVCRGELWAGVHPLIGWHIAFPILAQIQPVGSPSARRHALTRWASLPHYIDVEIGNLRKGIRLGYTPPRPVVEQVIGQVVTLAGAEGRTSPFYASARRDPDPEFGNDLEALVNEEILPALWRYATFLREALLPEARTEVPVAELPGGGECYRALARQFSGVDLPPDEIHRRGLQAMEEIRADARRVAGELSGAEPGTILWRARNDPDGKYDSREEMVEHVREIVALASSEAEAWFLHLPQSEVVVRPYPRTGERFAPGAQYVPPGADRSGRGTYWINTSGPRGKSRLGMETTAFHEVIPGHHVQLGINREKDHSHRLSRFLFFPGFTEGWGLYAERLAEEMNLYSSAEERIAMLNGQAIQAARVVVDSGIHARGWSRDRAVRYLEENVVLPRSTIEAEVDRIIAWPGQGPARGLGMIEIRRVRERAEAAMGSDFSIAEFHDIVLGDGSIPFSALNSKQDRWLSSRSGPRPIVDSQETGSESS